MFDSQLHIESGAKATLVSVICPKLDEHKNESETNRSLQEMRELLRTLKIEAHKDYIQNKQSLDPATIIGRGKLSEIAQFAKDEKSDLLVFDVELTASQIRNIKKISGLDVIDRCHVILEIFARHAQTKEAKIQIEIARLQYLLPRLSGFWSHLSRQRGGVGVKGGEGEQQIELDRRIVRERIEFYKKELKVVEKSREQQKKRRAKKAITAALVGYTNAGKSSLMNRLCKVDVLEEDKLFATLDSTYRMLNPDTKPPMILIDTVGFLSNLPNTLIDGFKTTLESTIEADLLIIIVDISDPHFEKHLEVTKQVLKELNADDKEQLIVFNKVDKLNDPLRAKIIKRSFPNSFLISALNKEDVNSLRSHVINYFLEKQELFEIFVPCEDGEAHSKVRSQTNIVTTSNFEKGIFYQVRVPQFIFDQTGLKSYIMAPHERELLS